MSVIILTHFLPPPSPLQMTNAEFPRMLFDFVLLLHCDQFPFNQFCLYHNSLDKCRGLCFCKSHLSLVSMEGLHTIRQAYVFVFD